MSSFASHDQHVLDSLVAIVAAYLFALPIGLERRAGGVSHVGLRTLPLVSVGACAYLLLGRYLYERGIFESDGEARMLRAVMTGIGFIGGGAIFKAPARGKGAGGITTAGAVWATGAIGASVAHGYYEVAAVLAVKSLFVVGISERLLTRRERRRQQRRRRALEKEPEG
ncbi:MAG TPA: MgtC/SapB family protein [Polyangiaceae bacterium]|nr:MgtC/SapB family protein [Polyangiaceae bacterium]